jgi:hypothetical protein
MIIRIEKESLKLSKQKRFYSSEILRSIRIKELAKIHTLFPDWWRTLK